LVNIVIAAIPRVIKRFQMISEGFPIGLPFLMILTQDKATGTDHSIVPFFLEGVKVSKKMTMKRRDEGGWYQDEGHTAIEELDMALRTREVIL
jgi:hypothetical protein